MCVDYVLVMVIWRLTTLNHYAKEDPIIFPISKHYAKVAIEKKLNENKKLDRLLKKKKL